jgi:hypothetical protein
MISPAYVLDFLTGAYDERALNASLQVLPSAAGYRSIIGPVFRDSIIS